MWVRVPPGALREGDEQQQETNADGHDQTEAEHHVARALAGTVSLGLGDPRHSAAPVGHEHAIATVGAEKRLPDPREGDGIESDRQ